MATFSQLPTTLDLTFIWGDQVDVVMDFDIDLTGYTFSAGIYDAAAAAATAGGGGIAAGSHTSYDEAVVESFTVTNTALSVGQIALGLTETQTSNLTVGGNYRWFLRWVAPGAVTRTVISGSVQVSNP
jgi:hypothetical protein